MVQSQSLSAQPLEQIAFADDLVGMDDQFIYVTTYPNSELKKRFSDSRYEILIN
jgi:hypothetical protein